VAQFESVSKGHRFSHAVSVPFRLRLYRLLKKSITEKSIAEKLWNPARTGRARVSLGPEIVPIDSGFQPLRESLHHYQANEPNPRRPTPAAGLWRSKTWCGLRGHR
jgi:hypothetical protein